MSLIWFTKVFDLRLKLQETLSVPPETSQKTDITWGDTVDYTPLNFSIEIRHGNLVSSLYYMWVQDTQVNQASLRIDIGAVFWKLGWMSSTQTCCSVFPVETCWVSQFFWGARKPCKNCGNTKNPQGCPAKELVGRLGHRLKYHHWIKMLPTFLRFGLSLMQAKLSMRQAACSSALFKFNHRNMACWACVKLDWSKVFFPKTSWIGRVTYWSPSKLSKLTVIKRFTWPNQIFKGVTRGSKKFNLEYH